MAAATYAVMRHQRKEKNATAALEEDEIGIEATVQDPEITAALRKGFTQVILHVTNFSPSGGEVHSSITR